MTDLDVGPIRFILNYVDIVLRLVRPGWVLIAYRHPKTAGQERALRPSIRN